MISIVYISHFPHTSPHETPHTSDKHRHSHSLVTRQITTFTTSQAHLTASSLAAIQTTYTHTHVMGMPQGSTLSPRLFKFPSIAPPSSWNPIHLKQMNSALPRVSKAISGLVGYSYLVFCKHYVGTNHTTKKTYKRQSACVHQEISRPHLRPLLVKNIQRTLQQLTLFNWISLLPPFLSSPPSLSVSFIAHQILQLFHLVHSWQQSRRKREHFFGLLV